jgi:hypothetical protein
VKKQAVFVVWRMKGPSDEPCVLSAHETFHAALDRVEQLSDKHPRWMFKMAPPVVVEK